ncbi:type VI secretion system amidase effector protein Tae4 [Burkholderia gladioli]|uniref:type VI secretion system amidase effector protein Tae4 n=1 Tax=Burkholderia gladioli TaxID=28095 RepID=UPI00163E7A0E|nr:type VI secretion system amidase effector protein Tae4 [Burkholderia gladioli]
MPHTKHASITSNDVPNSQKRVVVPAITFQELWNSFPSGDPYDDPAYTNQCAIRISVMLHRVGVDMKSFNAKTVRPMTGTMTIGRILLDGKPTATRAEELGTWLQLQPFAGLPKAEKITGADCASKIRGRTGIIQFSGYWARNGETSSGATGGHIDLWNGSRLTVSGFWSGFATWGRYLGISSFRQQASVFPRAAYSDLAGAKQILFREIK